MKAATAKAVYMLSAAAAFFLFCADASAATNALAPFFDKVKDQGLAIAGRAARDGTAEIDVYASDRITRFKFDADGKMTSAPSPLAFDARLLGKVKCSAADAAGTALAKADSRESEIRAVTLVDEDGTPVYCVASYDAKHKFLGSHRILCRNGSWDGWSDAVGEKDPLQK